MYETEPLKKSYLQNLATSHSRIELMTSNLRANEAKQDEILAQTLENVSLDPTTDMPKTKLFTEKILAFFF